MASSMYAFTMIAGIAGIAGVALGLASMAMVKAMGMLPADPQASGLEYSINPRKLPQMRRHERF